MKAYGIIFLKSYPYQYFKIKAYGEIFITRNIF